MKMGITIIEVDQEKQTFRAHHRDYHSSTDLDGKYSISIDLGDDEYIEIDKVNVDVLGDGAENSFFDVKLDEEFELSLSEAIAEYIEKENK
jgi:hypothetical protein